MSKEMNLEEAIKKLKEKQETLQKHIKNYEAIDCETDIYNELVEENEAIEIVLTELNNSISKDKIKAIIDRLDMDIKRNERRMIRQYDEDIYSFANTQILYSPETIKNVFENLLEGEN